MTMSHIARSFKVSLHICHPNIDPAEITEVLELHPKGTSRVGEGRRGHFRSEPLPGTYKFSHWWHEFSVEGALDLEPILEELLARLQPHKQFFRRVELFCGIVAAGNWDEVLSHWLMWHLADLRVDLRLDVYPKNTDEST